MDPLLIGAVVLAGVILIAGVILSPRKSPPIGPATPAGRRAFRGRDLLDQLEDLSRDEAGRLLQSRLVADQASHLANRFGAAPAVAPATPPN